MKSGPRLLQLEKALAQKRRPNIAINQSVNKSLKKKKEQNPVICDNIDESGGHYAK